jgi:pilus assembly protein CpaB
MANSGSKSGRILIIVALLLIVFVVAAALLFNRFRPLFQPAESAVSDSPQIQIEEMVDIVITTQFVNRGDVIDKSVVTMIPFPKNELVDGTFFTTMESVVGKRAIYPLEARIPITPGMVIDGATGGSIAAFDIPVDKTALSVLIDRVSMIAYAPQPGDHVMIIGCMELIDVDPEYQTMLPNYTGSVSKQILTAESSAESLSVIISSGGEGSTQGRTELDPTLNEPIYVVPSELQRPRLVCQNIVQDAIILRLGDFPITGAETTVAAEEEAAQVPVEGEEATEPEISAPDIVTLVVSPQDAVVLTYMRKANIYLTLALRNPNNTQTILTDAVTQQYLMDQKNIPLPAKLPFALEPRIGLFAPISEP